MHCLVFGGSGQIGTFLLPQLRAAGMRVTAISRVPRAGDDGVQWLQGRLPDAVPALPSVPDALICLGPLDHLVTWLAGAEGLGSPGIVAMSSMSAQSKRHSPDAAERALAANLRTSEQALLAHCEARGASCIVLRSTMIHGAGLDRGITPLARFALRWRVFPWPLGRGLRQPVHAEDVAFVVRAALSCAQGTRRVLEIGGGERLSATAMFARVRSGLPRWTLPLPLPRALLWVVARMLGRGTGMVARLGQDLVADNEPLAQLLGVHPRAFEPRFVARSTSRSPANPP